MFEGKHERPAQQHPRQRRGFTLVEVLIVLTVLAILAAVVIPNFTGSVSRGRRDSYLTDENIIQSAVDTYYLDTEVEGVHLLPIKGINGDRSSGGTPQATWNDDGDGIREDGEVSWLVNGVDTSGYFIDFDLLVEGRYLRSIPASASADNKPGLDGSYGWYVDEQLKVGSVYYFDPTKYGFQPDIYP
jgi:prepilin-type N-terminal cleavage/methylation domain-containing protein